MSKIIKINGADMEQVLRSTTRQYFVGNLKKPQSIDFIRDHEIEIGLTEYQEYSIEQPHVHHTAKEYQLVLEGYTEYLDVTTKEKYQFSKGDFYKIDKDTVYAQKSAAGTKILFIKIPSINDKIVIDAEEQVEKWYREKV